MQLFVVRAVSCTCIEPYSPVVGLSSMSYTASAPSRPRVTVPSKLTGQNSMLPTAIVSFVRMFGTLLHTRRFVTSFRNCQPAGTPTRAASFVNASIDTHTYCIGSPAFCSSM